VDEKYDVVVVGGGAAGLSAALTLGRARRSVLVVDAGTPRNAPADQVHNYLGREGTPPLDLLATGRTEVERYGGVVTTGRAVLATRTEDDGLRLLVEDAAGRRTVAARRLLVATGLTDGLPAVPGLAERWGRDVVHCPYCHGWEIRDQPIGVLASGPLAVHQAVQFSQLSGDVTLFQHTVPALAEADLERLAVRGVRIVTGEVVGVDVTGDRLTGLRLASGETVAVRAVVVQPRFDARADLLADLGLEPVEQRVGDHVIGSYVPADPRGATAVPGVWVAGNVADVTAQVISSAAAGLNVAAAVNGDLIEEEIRDALARRRHAASPAGA
jgi:thioredoxin reductase